MKKKIEPGRLAALAIPTVSVIVTALVLVGPGALRPAVGVRVYGSPAEGDRALSVRLMAVSSLYGSEDVATLDRLQAVAKSNGRDLDLWNGRTGADGVAEAVLTGELPLERPLSLAVFDGTADPKNPRFFASGRLALHGRDPSPTLPSALPGTARGELSIRVEASRGLLAAPFPETLKVWVDPSPGGKSLKLHAGGAGLEITRLGDPDLGAMPALFSVKALVHDVELTIDAENGDARGHWEGRLPIVPGALWLEPGDGPRSIVSPVPRDRVYASFWSPVGRLDGAVVELQKDGSGFFRGQLDARRALPAPVFVTLAGDPQERGAGTVLWPLAPKEGGIKRPALELLLDGVPAAIAKEKDRAWRARLAGLVVLGTAAAVEVVLLLLLSRSAQRNLEKHLGEASEGEERAVVMRSAKENPVLRVLLFVAVIALGFAMMGAIAAFR